MLTGFRYQWIGSHKGDLFSAPALKSEAPPWRLGKLVLAQPGGADLVATSRFTFLSFRQPPGAAGRTRLASSGFMLKKELHCVRSRVLTSPCAILVSSDSFFHFI